MNLLLFIFLTFGNQVEAFAGQELNRIDSLASGVYFVLDPECPLSKRYSLYINQMEYADLEVFLIFANKDKKSVADFISKYITIEHIRINDRQLNYVKALNATTYPEAFLIGMGEKKEYQGIINNWYSSISRKRRGPSVHYLQDAINQFIKGEEVKITYKEPIGCYIERGS